MEKNLFDRILNGLCMTPAALCGLILLMVLPFIPPFNQEYLIRWLVGAGLIAAASIAFDFTAGFINIVNFGFYAFVGFGGYVSALLAIHWGLHPGLGMLAGAFLAGILGLMLGFLTLRQRGIFAAVVTWFLGLSLMGLATQLTGLTRGVLGLRSPLLFPTTSNLPYFYLILGLMVVIYIVTKWVVRSNMGLAFKAIGQNMDAARTSGINPVFYRVSNFTLSCFFAGLLGGFYAHFYGVLTPEVMSTSKTVEVLVVAYIGGRSSLWGGAVIAFPFVFAMELLRSSLSDLPGVNLVLYGVFLTLVMIYYPNGASQFYKDYLSHPKSRLLNYFMNGRQEAEEPFLDIEAPKENKNEEIQRAS
ncbi:MAG: branched-chain amino acid ABC transporter permease [Deltaproteobacteria bacterium]|nr:branched-chain amino acid ABC transporter permease [Deltaproteobacteria bacterium]